MVTRADRGVLANWWWTVDRWILAACLVLIGIGVLLSFASSPAVANRLDVNSFHFIKRQMQFVLPALMMMIFVSFLSPRSIRRMCLIGLGIAFVLMVLTLYMGVEIKGARRWLTIAGTSIQPSEFMKPVLIVICAWLMAEQCRRAEIPGIILSGILALIAGFLLVSQRDFGQTFLLISTWGAMSFIAGISWFFIILLLIVGVVFGYGAFLTVPHVRERILAFVSDQGDRYQVDISEKAITHGGWFGRGPGEGTYKYLLPDSHTDFVISVAIEEYGVILCLIIVALFSFIVLRCLYVALKEREPFNRLAISGLVILFGFQSVINLAVNLHLMPPKGMTLPFISYGGSSLIAIALTMGILLALTRRRPQARFSSSPDYVPVMV